MKRSLSALLLATALFSGIAFSAQAEEVKPDDQVVFTLSAENWVTTKTARVTLNVEAAVTASTSGTMRATMNKSVNDVVKAEWRLTGFSRSQDQTGMERWSAMYDARVPENELNGLDDKAKKVSKAGMQITVGNVDFSPTLDEVQEVINLTRTQIYKQANDQLTALNVALPGRGYRIASIDFVNTQAGPSYATKARPMLAMARGAAAGGAMMDASNEAMPAMEKSEKIMLSARIIMAAVPPVAK